jgi:hypothetical protein
MGADYAALEREICALAWATDFGTRRTRMNAPDNSLSPISSPTTR